MRQVKNAVSKKHNPLLGRQFYNSEPDYDLPKHPTKNTTDAVFDQMSEDYPKSAIEWVHDIKWRGPIQVPLKNVDFNDKYTWKAEKQPEKVKHFRQRILRSEAKGEHVKPVVMIQRPDKTAMIPDGHHRALAYKELNKPIYAWVGYPDKSKGPWDYVHDSQFKPSTGPQRQGDKNENIYR